MSFFKKFVAILVALTMLLSLTACQQSNNQQADEKPPAILDEPMTKTTYQLGTVIELKVFDDVGEDVLNKAVEKIAEIEAKMTINNAETSEIIQLNESSGEKEVKVSPDTFYVLEVGKQYSEMSGGIFDITVGPLVKAWNIGTDYAAVPDPVTLAEDIKLIDYNKLTLNKDNLTAKLLQKGMKVDLGAIAKGYTADAVGEVLREFGVRHALISLGGNMLVIGGNPNGNPWKIGVQDPFSLRGDFIGIIPAVDKTIVTSGTYERYFEQDGKIYHHILDPKTGYPVENNLNSVSIFTEKSIIADALSTTTLLMGLERGYKYIESLEGVEAVFITNDKEVYVTSGLKKDFTLTKSEFTLKEMK